LVALGFLVVLAVFTLAVAFFGSATEIASLVAPITTLVGTLIGAVFGVQVGSQGREQLEASKTEAERGAQEAAAMLDPDAGEKLVAQWTAAGR
jgi:hypothetical protein